MPRTTVRLTFSGVTTHAPVIYEMGREYRVVTNIRKANVGEDAGWIELEIEGEEPEVARALDYCREQGVTVEALS